MEFIRNDMHGSGMEEKFGFYDTSASGATSCELSARDGRMIERGRAARDAFTWGARRMLGVSGLEKMLSDVAQLDQIPKGRRHRGFGNPALSATLNPTRSSWLKQVLADVVAQVFECANSDRTGDRAVPRNATRGNSCFAPKIRKGN
ncbi:hypothetical protein NL676_027261 [Syzygium grande]|nr:hypothetical protein NL676_027261 [Syzygium grande]